MKAVVWHDVGDIRLEEVAEPAIKHSTDAILRVTTSAICGTDLHMIRGTMSGLRNGVILGHEGVGIVEEIGIDVRNLNIGDRVVIPSTLACGYCAYCRDGYYSQCDHANPKGPGTAFFGGPETAGGLNGLQAEKALVPNAPINLIKLPDNVTDEQAILLSDIFPTGYFGADLADIKPGHTVAVYGCGPVGLFTILSAQLMDAGRIIAIDNIPSRLATARRLGAEIINFDDEDPVATIKRLTGEIGVDRVIDAVGVDANCPHHHSFLGGIQDAIRDKTQGEIFRKEKETVAPKQNPQDGNWEPGDAPSQALRWAVESVAKAGTISIIGVYPQNAEFFPLGMAMNKNLTIRMGNCNHKKYIPKLLKLVQAQIIDPTIVLSQIEPLTNVLEAYQSFDNREFGWTKVVLEPSLSS